MATKMIANLKPGDGDEPIEIKVIRKWISFGTRNEYCFIFIDKNGDAIQAGASAIDKNYFDSIIKINSCYCLSNYICEPGKTYMVTVPHNTGIRLGKAAKFLEIPDDGFPVNYFAFIEYDQLPSRVENDTILTDYIGKIENITKIPTSKGSTIMKIKLENLSGKMIQATFWEDIAVPFNKEAVTKLPSPVIAAVTSMKVTRFQGALQLSASPASFIYINPDIAAAKRMASEFTVKKDVLKIQYEKSGKLEAEIHRNRFTLAQLLAQNPSRYMGTSFTCKASLTDIDESKEWFYKSCDKCNKKVHPRGTASACEDHGDVMEPKHLYFFTANLTDHTAEAKIVFFDAAAAQLLQTKCITMTNQLGYTDRYTLPTPILALKGKTKIFQLKYNKSSKPGNIEFVADNVFEDVIIESHTTQSLDSSTPAPATPPAKHHLHTSAKEELFQTPGDSNTQPAKKHHQSDNPSAPP